MVHEKRTRLGKTPRRGNKRVFHIVGQKPVAPKKAPAHPPTPQERGTAVCVCVCACACARACANLYNGGGSITSPSNNRNLLTVMQHT